MLRIYILVLLYAHIIYFVQFGNKNLPTYLYCTNVRKPPGISQLNKNKYIYCLLVLHIVTEKKQIMIQRIYIFSHIYIYCISWYKAYDNYQST